MSYPPLDSLNAEDDTSTLQGAKDALEKRLTSIESESYRQNTKMAVENFLEFIDRLDDLDELEDIEVIHCRRWVQDLARRAREGEIAASTARTYYALVRATWKWWVDDERVSMNPMRPKRVEEELPEDDGQTDTQFWDPADREQLVEFVDREAHDALEDETKDAIREFRDRALVYLLADTGVRGAEILATRDAKRNGVTFGDVDAETPSLTVFGKAREYEQAGLTDAALRRVQRLQSLLDAPDEWPILPTLHRPTLHQHAREALQEADVDAGAVLDDADSVFEVLREFEIVPPALTVDGGRSVMQRLCRDADLDVDEGYLKPHGGRRALGDELYAIQAETAQDVLRHKNIETTHESYREQQVGEVAKTLDEVRHGSDSGENDE